MNERKRLIELLNTATAEFRFDSWENTDKIADFLLANGVIVPPCKMGEPLYRVCSPRGLRQKPSVREIKLLWTNLKQSLADYGTLVFLTREEAERVANGKQNT